MQLTHRLVVLFFIMLSAASYPVVALEPGKVTGSVNFVTPDWF